MKETKELLNSFKNYCNKYPHERFYQALKNWMGVNFLLVAESMDDQGNFENIEDTFNWEEKDK